MRWTRGWRTLSNSARRSRCVPYPERLTDTADHSTSSLLSNHNSSTSPSLRTSSTYWQRMRKSRSRSGRSRRRTRNRHQLAPSALRHLPPRPLQPSTLLRHLHVFPTPRLQSRRPLEGHLNQAQALLSPLFSPRLHLAPVPPLKMLRRG